MVVRPRRPGTYVPICFSIENPPQADLKINEIMEGPAVFLILVINPGSTTTKLALYQDETSLWTETITYTASRLSPFQQSLEQVSMRFQDIKNLLDSKEVHTASLSAVAARGGPFKSLRSGTYAVTERLVHDIEAGHVQADHISNTGAILAYRVAEEGRIPAYFVDPVSVDEFSPVARLSGLPELERKSLLHALNIRATCFRAAADLGRPVDRCNFIVAHMGGGISVCPVQEGRMIDVNNANEEGPFSPERTGTLPAGSLAKLCFSGKYTYDQIRKKLVGQGGMTAYLGTSDLQAVEKRIAAGDEEAGLVVRAMAYQIAKEIGAMATVLKGRVDAVLLTGGLAKSDLLNRWIGERIRFLGPVLVYAGENEMDALCLGVLRVLRNEEAVRDYHE